MMAAEAIVERELGIESGVRKQRTLYQAQGDARCTDLASEPQHALIDLALAFDVVRIDGEVLGLILRERVQLESQSWMSRADHGVRHVSAGRAEVARETQLRARRGPIGRVHAAREVGRVCRVLLRVCLDPALGAAVTRLALDAVDQLEARTATSGRHIVR